MERTSLYFRMVNHKAAYSVKCFFEIYENLVPIQLMLKILFTQDFEAGDLHCDASPGSELSRLFFSNNLFSLGFESVYFYHDFA